MFYEEELDVPLVLFDEVLEHVLRIDRIFRQPQGHLLLIGVSGGWWVEDESHVICNVTLFVTSRDVWRHVIDGVTLFLMSCPPPPPLLCGVNVTISRVNKSVTLVSHVYRWLKWEYELKWVIVGGLKIMSCNGEEGALGGMFTQLNRTY